MLNHMKEEILHTRTLGNTDSLTTEWIWMLMNQYALAVQYGNGSAFEGFRVTHLLMSEIKTAFDLTRGLLTPTKEETNVTQHILTTTYTSASRNKWDYEEKKEHVSQGLEII